MEEVYNDALKEGSPECIQRNNKEMHVTGLYFSRRLFFEREPLEVRDNKVDIRKDVIRYGFLDSEENHLVDGNAGSFLKKLENVTYLLYFYLYYISNG
jgi:hypothetical protein